jgi:hypothetical protein
LDSCPITAGGSSLPLTWPGEQPLNALDESWWDFYTNTGEKNDFPLLHFEIDGQFLTNHSFQIAESTPPFTILFDSGDTTPGNDFPFGPVIQNGVLHAQVSGLAGNGTFEGRKYFFKVKRTAILDTSGNPCLTTFPPCVEQTAGQRTIETSWGTNLTYFYPHHLIALDNEDTQVGVLNKDDEIHFLVDTEAYPTTERTAAFALFGDDVDDGGHAYPADAFGIPRYVTNLQTDMVEWDDFAYQQTYLQPRETPLRDNNPDCLAATGICPVHRRTQALNSFRTFYAPVSDPDTHLRGHVLRAPRTQRRRRRELPVLTQKNALGSLFEGSGSPFCGTQQVFGVWKAAVWKRLRMLEPRSSRCASKWRCSP